MRTLGEIRKNNRRECSLLNKPSNPVQLTSEQYAAGRKEYENFVKPVTQRVFVRQLIKGNV